MITAIIVIGIIVILMLIGHAIATFRDLDKEGGNHE